MTDQPILAEATGEAAPAVFGSFASGVAITFTTRILIVACTLATSIIVAHWLGPKGTGTLAVLNVTVALASQLGSAGIPSATTYFVAKDRNRLPLVWANGLLLSVTAGVLIAIGVVLLANV